MKNGDPAMYATIYIKSLQQGAISNEKGYYELPGIPYGKHLIEIKTLEAEPLSSHITVNRELIEHSPILEANSNFNLSEVIVYGKSEMKKLKDQGYAVGLIDTRKMESQSIQTTELLDRTAGVRIRQSGGMGSDIQYNINGLTGNSVRIFIDGIPIRNYGSSFSLSSIPPAMIERIEVYKGVVPGELAEDALGGAINVILKKANISSLTTSYSYGSFNTHRWDMSANYRNSKSGFMASGSAFYNSTDNSYKVWGDQIYITDPKTGEMDYITAKRFHDGYESYGLNADFGFTNVKWADRFLIGILLSRMEKDIQHGATMSAVYANRSSNQNTRMINLKYAKKDIVKGLNADVFVSYSYGIRNMVDTVNYKYNWEGEIYKRPSGEYVTWATTGEGGAATLAENTEKMLAGRGNLSYKFLPGQKLTAHYLFNRFIRDVDDPMLLKIQRELMETRYLTKNIVGATYEGNWLKDKLKTILFMKHYGQHVELVDPVKVDNEYVPEKHDRSMSSNGYGVAASYELISGVILLASAEKALRMPGGTELLGNTTENVEASYDLRPESSNNINIGGNAGPFSWGNHRVAFDINFFYRDIKDMIARKVYSTTTNQNYGYENLGKVRSKGVDMELRYNYGSMINLTSNLSVFNARFNQQYDEYGAEYIYYKDRLRNAPYFTSNSNLEFIRENVFQKGSRLSINYNFSYVHEFFRNWESLGSSGKTTIPKQLIHDAAIVYTFPKHKVTISFDAKNFTNEQVFDNWALQKAGRAFYGKISYRIF